MKFPYLNLKCFVVLFFWTSLSSGLSLENQGLEFLGFGEVQADNICFGSDAIGHFVQISSIYKEIEIADSPVALSCHIISKQKKPNVEMKLACDQIDKRFWDMSISKIYLYSEEVSEAKESFVSCRDL